MIRTFTSIKQDGQGNSTNYVTKLSVLYYPTLIWAYIDKSLRGDAIRTPEREQAQDEEAAGEREPLLR